MNKRRPGRRVQALLLAAVMAVTVLTRNDVKSYAATDLSTEELEEIVSTYNIDKSIPGYKEYLELHKDAGYPSVTAVAGGESYVRYEEDGEAAAPEIFENYDGMQGKSILTGENSLVEFEIQVQETGFYNLALVYYPVEGKNTDIERSVFIDGALPFEELYLVKFQRVWKSSVKNTYRDGNGVEVKKWEKDNQGNDLKPGSVEVPQWQKRYFYDSNGYTTTPLYLYLEKGEHTVSLLSRKEPMLIKELVLSNENPVKSYQEVLAGWETEGGKDSSGKEIVIEGEYASRTSSQMLYPRQDQSSPAVFPSSTKELLNNSIGGNSWRLNGQWIEWEFEVEEGGYYYISLHDKQNFSRGVDVSRRITIDGEIPFAEMSEYAFGYQQSWREDVLADEERSPYKFYLEAGRHTLRMEVVLGQFSEIVGLVQEAVQRLNGVYRQVIKVTGVAPDKYRDYQLASMLPGLKDEMTAARAILNEALEKLEVTAGKNSDKKAVLLTMRDQLDDLIRDEEYFVRTLKAYKVNVRACGNWIAQVISQPLQIDRICVYSPDVKLKYEHNTIFAKLGYEIARLFYSFIIDYNNIGSVAEGETDEQKAITLWIGSGRDQANVIKALIDETFTNETGIRVNVQLVDMSTLLKASLVGEGPDVAIQVANTNGAAGAVLNTGNDTPINYGIRNAVLDLTQFGDLGEITARFPKSSMTPLTYDGAVFALPETITYPVMFYRKDILAEVGLELPETWDEVKVAMTVLAKNQMEFGMLPTEQLFASMLYQQGGSYYTEDARASELDSDVAVGVFKEFCEYFTDYKLDKETSVEERFRTGECPLMIADYTVYNNFAVSAPDIAGLWSFTQIPGTKKEDGTVDHSVASTGLASMIMADTKYPEDSWEFLKWWTGAETQTWYGREMESLMGSAARVPTANYGAFLNMPWPVNDFRALQESMEWTKGIPQIPGGYYSWRNVYNAFFAVVNNPDTSLPREELMDKVISINAEITYKREELELDSARKQ